MDTIGKTLWILMFCTPLITVPLAWKFGKLKKVMRVIIGLLTALMLSFFLYHLSLAVIFREGMGPDSP